MRIAEVTFTGPDRVRDVIHDHNADGFEALCLPERREVKKIAKSEPVDHGLPFSAWSLSKLADFLVTEGTTTSATRDFGPAREGDVPGDGRGARRTVAPGGHPEHKIVVGRSSIDRLQCQGSSTPPGNRAFHGDHA
ncbi:hypothetical protein J1792_31550 [Streptomyces triculaminicus]|uniref:Uncharacterized protein n=2 Tax=Streptomyces TaxID=1883 RepID=A0A939JTN2_9ACTN|nr:MULTISPECIES: hypothetical protein [Streptomyces]MBO0657102.1 hypothetical protein [Streptomyces triculaminicus]QSY49510.1 hypothetical protein J3S04_32235 [Streptomyces griseocarneus]